MDRVCSENNLPIKSIRFDSIQALRGVAALAVLILHSTIDYFQGAWGVDLFFCISGFIMMYVTQLESKHFLIKRAIRIIPLYWGLTLAKFAMAYIGQRFGIVLPVILSLESLLKSLFFWLPNENIILSVGWTLNYEIRFYMIFAIACFINIKYRGILAGLAVCIYSLFPPLEVIGGNGVCLEFAYGIAAFYIVQAIKDHYQPTKTKTPLFLIAALGFLGLTYILGLFEFEIGRQYYWGLPTLGLFLTTVIGLNHVKWKWLAKIGDMSYSIYLVHVFITEIIYGLSILLGLA